MSRSRWILFLILSAAVVTFFSQALLHPSMFYVHDHTHVSRLAEMRLALEAGHFPVQWSQNFGYGYGMPLFLFYGPLPFYIAYLLNSLGFSDIGAIKGVFALSTLLSWVGIFWWFRKRGWSVAIPASLVLVAAPYRAVDIFVRGALNEVVAIGILPFVLVAAKVFTRSPKTGTALTALSVAALLLSHNLTALIGLPILGAIGAIWLFLFSEKPKQFIPLYALGSLLGVGLAAFATVPSILEQSYTSIGAIFSGYFDFRLHFLYIRQLLFENWGYGGSASGPEDGMSFHVGLPILISVGLLGFVLLGALLSAWKQKPTFSHVASQIVSRRYIWLMTVTGFLGFSLFMTLFHAQPIWESISVLAKVQFPWRFLAVSSVLGALLCGEVLAKIQKKTVRWTLSLLIITLCLTQVQFHQAEKYLETPTDLYSAEPQSIQNRVSSILPDYIPAGFDQSLPPISTEERITLNGQILKSDFNSPQRIRLLVEEPTTGLIQWNIAHFPGWKYFIDNQEVTPELGEDGRMSLLVSSAPQSVGAEFTATPVRALSGWVSLFSLIIVLSLLLPNAKFEKERGVRVPNL